MSKATEVPDESGQKPKGGETSAEKQPSVIAILCEHAVHCVCITNGVRAKQIRKTAGGNKLAAGGVPACCSEIRDIIAPGKTGAQILELYPRSK